MNDNISRCELFNRLAAITAEDANDMKAKIYAVIQEMETAPERVIAQIHVDSEEILNRIKEEYYMPYNWIPASEHHPDDEKRVLCQTRTKKGAVNMVIGYYADGRWCCGMNSNVEAWMSLPEPYEEEAR